MSSACYRSALRTYLPVARLRKDRSAPVADPEGLSLAQACLKRDGAAIAELDACLANEVATAMRRLRASQAEAEEILQELRAALFAPREGARSKLHFFCGKGSIRGWLRALAGQELARLKRDPRRAAWETVHSRFPQARTSPESVLGRAQHAAAVHAALEASIRGLPLRERTALKLNALEGLSVDDLSQMFRTHRSTVARWIQRARLHIAQEVQAAVKAQLRLTSAEAENIVRQAWQEVPVTLERAFATSR